MIVIVDYGMGNLRNVRAAFQELKSPAVVTSEPGAIDGADLLILPGVGAFGEAVRRIDDLGLRAPIARFAEAGKPLLGVCLGMQLLFEQSEESPGMKGLGLLPGAVVKFGNGLKVPHVGWNDVIPSGSGPLFDGVARGECFYFVHSYFVPDCRFAIAHTEYGVRFASAVQSGNIFGVQFHPEKSQSAGLRLLQNLLTLASVGSVNN
jgi:glutamine amidotransferase